MRLSLMLALIVALAACAPVPVVDGPDVTPPADDPLVRPDIPRTEHPDDPIYEEPAEQPHNGTVFLPDLVRETVLEVPLNDTIGEHYPILTAREFSLLKHRAILLDGASALPYREEILFDFKGNTTGWVLFTEEDGLPGTRLFFAEDKPILEYRLTLDRGRFEDVTGREIQVLGRTYLIADANNRTVELFGVDVPSNYLFENGSRLLVNSTRWPDTEVRVTPGMIAFRIYAPDLDDGGLLLDANESLADNIGGTRLGLLDLRYLGAEQDSYTQVALQGHDTGYRMDATLLDGRRLEMDLVELDAGRLVLGGLDTPLRIGCTGFCIAPEESFLITSPRGNTFLVEYRGVSEESETLRLRIDGNTYGFDTVGNLSTTARADIILDDEIFRVSISKGNLSVPYQRSDYAEIILEHGFALRVRKPTNSTLPLEIVIPAVATASRKEERTWLNITHNDIDDGRGWHVRTNVALVEDEDTDDRVGRTPYGVTIIIDDDEDGIVRIPSMTSIGLVAIEGG